MTQDRAHSDTFSVTHEFLAWMLGVRRVGVTGAASALQRRQLITYSRGVVKVLDRAGLEAASCPCYRVNKSVYDRGAGLAHDHAVCARPHGIRLGGFDRHPQLPDLDAVALLHLLDNVGQQRPDDIAQLSLCMGVRGKIFAYGRHFRSTDGTG